MQVQIFVDGVQVDAQKVPTGAQGSQPSAHDAKRIALQSSLRTKNISIKDALRSTLLVLDDDGKILSER